MKHDVETPPITVSEAQSCVEKLRRFFQGKDGGCDFFFAIDQMEMFINKTKSEESKADYINRLFYIV